MMSEPEIIFFLTLRATLDVVLPFEVPGNDLFKSRLSGKYRDFSLYPGRFKTGTIRIVPAINEGSNAPSGL